MAENRATNFVIYYLLTKKDTHDSSGMFKLFIYSLSTIYEGKIRDYISSLLQQSIEFLLHEVVAIANESR